MTYDQLIQLQGLASIVLLVCLATGAIHLVLGCIRPSWVGRAGRGKVVAISCGVWLAGLVIFAGTIAYTHANPNGPHSATGYIEGYFAEQCASGADIPACKKPGEAVSSKGAEARPSAP